MWPQRWRCGHVDKDGDVGGPASGGVGIWGVVVTSRPTHVSQELVVLAVSAPDGLGYSS